MYQQDTRFSAANTPLFTQIFGSSSTTTTPRPSECSPNGVYSPNKSTKQNYSPIYRAWDQNLATPAACYSAASTIADASDSNGFVEPVDNSKEVSHPAPHDGDVSMHESRFHKTERDSSEDDASQTSKGSVLPFREVMRELERRFGEQMDVHRTLNTSMRQLDLLKSEISLFQSEQRTAQVALTIQQAFLSSFQDAASVNAVIATATAVGDGELRKDHTASNTTTSNGSTHTNATAVATTPFLQHVLESYEKERTGATHVTTVQSQSPRVEQARRPPVEVIRPPEEPTPYKRIFFVPVEKHQEPASGSTSSDGRYDSHTFSNSSGSVSAATAVSTEVSYTDSFMSSGGVSTDLSVSASSQSRKESIRGRDSSSSSSSRASCTSSSSNVTQKVTPSSIVEDISVTRTLQKRNNDDNIPLLDGLREFYQACSSANRLMQILLGSNGSVGKRGKRRDADRRSDSRHVKPQKFMSSVKNDDKEKKKDYDADGCETWLTSIRRDVGDVRKLRRFIDHLRSNIKAMDYQSRVQKARQNLLRNAQRLAKARKRMQRDGLTLSDVKDNIVDLIQSDSLKGVDSDVIDDMAIVASFSWGSPVDSVEDVVDDDDDGVDDAVDYSDAEMIIDEVSNVMERSSTMEEGVLDELQEQMTIDGGDGDGRSEVEDILSEFPGGMSLPRAESEFAEILAEVSDINDILEDEVPLPSVSLSVVEDNVMPSSVPSSVADVVSTHGVREEHIRGGASAVDDVSEEDVLTVFTDVSDLDDADVSSVLPPSTSSERTDVLFSQHAGEMEGDDNSDSAESALSALESEIQQTRRRRAMALLKVHPQTFTALYSVAAVPNDNNNNNNNNNNDIGSENERYGSAEANTGRSSSSSSGSSTGEEERKHSCVAESGKDRLLLTVPEDASRKSFALSTAPTDKHHSVSINDDLPAAIAATRTNTDMPVYAADDLLSQLGWKERQLLLFRELRPRNELTDMNGQIIDDEKELPLEERSEYHWGMLESLLHCRFGSGTAAISSEDDSLRCDEISCCDFSDYTENSDDSIPESSSDDDDNGSLTNVLESL